MWWRMVVPGSFYRTIGLVYKNQILLLSVTDLPCMKCPFVLVLNLVVGCIYQTILYRKQWFLLLIQIHLNTECTGYSQSVQLKHDSFDLIGRWKNERQVYSFVCTQDRTGLNHSLLIHYLLVEMRWDRRFAHILLFSQVNSPMGWTTFVCPSRDNWLIQRRTSITVSSSLISSGDNVTEKNWSMKG